MGGRSKGQIPGQGGEKRDGLPRGGGASVSLRGRPRAEAEGRETLPQIARQMPE